MAENSVSLKAPNHLSLSENGMPVVWKLWIQQFEWYAIATNLENKSQAVQVATFMIAIGPDAANIFNTFSLSEAESVIKTKFDAYFALKTNIPYERYLFNKIMQIEGQPFDDFLTLVVNQGKKCEFGELCDSLLLDKIVVGVCIDTVCKNLLVEEDLTFDKTVQIYRVSEITKLQVSAMKGNTLPGVHAMHISHKKISPESQETEFKTKSKCPKCSYNHPQRTCPAVGKECKKCGKVGPFAKVCWSNQVLTVNSGQQGRTPEPSSSETFFVSSIDIHHELDWIEKLTLPNGNSVSFKLDTRVQCNVLSSLIAQRALITIRPSKTKTLVSFSKDSVPVLGEADGHQCILGREMCENVGFIKWIETAIFDGEVFDGIECLKGFAYDIDLIDKPNLHIYLPRRVKEELDSMVQNDIIEPITEPTPAVSPMVVVHKNGKVRICIDPSGINKNLKRWH
ncbi:hypothetical protein PR048_014413 [Dryococelus australis]|uniref:Uncharacterized protein n=1 Tax=Dryococelus australis TaxID=614101 RepID=A0ABQ9HE56_9NEOP|nr:hypothetical protein PR048_014413 [Dryococelus australis]